MLPKSFSEVYLWIGLEASSVASDIARVPGTFALLLATHAGVIRLALSWVFDDIDYFFKFKVDNGSINTISIDGGYKFIKKMNYSPRL